MQVVVFGGGVAGLTAAVALHAVGYPARVFERRPGLVAGGQGFILSPTALAQLAQLGLPPILGGVQLRQFRRYRPTGERRLIQEIPHGWRAIRRSALVAALRNQLPAFTVTPGATLTNLSLDGAGRVTGARLSTGGPAGEPAEQPVRADLYIAADGVRSVARRTLFPHWPQPSARVWEIVAAVRDPEVSDWTGADFHKFSIPGVAAGLVPVGDQTVVWFIQFDRERFPLPAGGPVGSDAPPAGPATGALAHRLVGDWAHPLPALLRLTDFTQVHVWRPVDADLLPQFHSGNVALVGDAAHPLLPFTSQGVAAAIAGARDLVTAVTSNRCLDAALAAYSAACRVRCTPYIGQGRELTRQFLHPDGRTSDLLPMST